MADVLDYRFDDYMDQRPSWPKRSLEYGYRLEAPYEFAVVIQEILQKESGQKKRPTIGIYMAKRSGMVWVYLGRSSRKIARITFKGLNSKGFPKVAILQKVLKPNAIRLLGFTNELETSDVQIAADYVTRLLALSTAPGSLGR